MQTITYISIYTITPDALQEQRTIVFATRSQPQLRSLPEAETPSPSAQYKAVRRLLLKRERRRQMDEPKRYLKYSHRARAHAQVCVWCVPLSRNHDQYALAGGRM